MMAKLLVSVRSASEAEAALEGGAGIIDVKEPLHGSLGCAATSVILSVLQTVKGRIPVSAALGELTLSRGRETPEQGTMRTASRPGLNFVKWGLAGAGRNWRDRLLHAASPWLFNKKCHPVAVAYADWRQSRSPFPYDVLDFVGENHWNILLLDTFTKDGRTLMDWMSYDEIAEICQRSRETGILIALAGSLGSQEISQLLPLQPDVFAVRGAVCRGRDRRTTVDRTLVSRIAGLLSARNKFVHAYADIRCRTCPP
jgi:uncharacterized protein (UPF0264 family)